MLLQGLKRRVNEREQARERAAWYRRGRAFADGVGSTGGPTYGDAGNPLRAFFNGRTAGRGIWKWDHYFDTYHRHFEGFRGTDAHILEIGIYSGGSLDMWHDYFGPRAHVYGVDIQQECTRYEDDATTVFIGDQSDRSFWQRVRAEVPKLDVVIDDGGHQPEQQSVSFEELFPHLQPGGVYLVEDLHGPGNRFAAYVHGLTEALSTYRGVADHTDPERRKTSAAIGFQSMVDSIHSYTYVTVIEKRRTPLGEFISPKHGTEWEPFLR
jgi:hypothetical protein